MELKGKKVLVFGAGKSGIGAADLLGAVGAIPVIYDGKADLDKESVIHKTSGKYELLVYAGELPEEVVASLDLVVLSPGVPTDLPLVKSFYEKGLPVWGEVELAYRKGRSSCNYRNKWKNNYNSSPWKDHEGCPSICICSRKYWNTVYIQGSGNDR